MFRLLLAALLPLASACASYTALSPDEVARIDRGLTGGKEVRYLDKSFYVTPFFGDGTKRLLTDVPPEEVRLLNDTGGKPISPGEVEKILPAGTRVRITKVEFPTALAVTGRMLYTPRTQPWVYVQTEADSDPRPLIVVLRPQIKTEAEFHAELDAALSPTDPAKQLEAMPESVQAAIREKRAVIDMSAEALEMAWGSPERIKVDYPKAGEGGPRTEVWTWPGGRRRAELIDGRVSKLEGGEGAAN